MDVTPSIWLSSVSSALLFFSGGRLWDRAQRAISPLLDGDGSARAKDAAEIRRLSEIAARREQEAAELRAKVEEMKAALATARAGVEGAVLAQSAAPPALRPQSGRNLEESIVKRLDELRVYDRSCQAAALSDYSGLLVATSTGDAGKGDTLAAAASMTSDTASRLRDLLRLGEPVEVRLVFSDDTVFKARWIKGDHEGLLLATFGAGRAEPTPRVDAIRAAISNLMRWT